MRLNVQSLKFHTLAGFLNIAIVIVAVGSSAGWWIQTNVGTVVHAVPTSVLAARRAAHIKQGKPVQLLIPSLSVDLRVLDGTYNPGDGSWTLDDTHAFFATISSEINTANGTSLIYGHNLDAVFSRLKNLRPGSQLFVTTDSNYRFTYTYSSAAQVSPDDTSIFSYQSQPNVTLQTCSGDWDQLRTLHTFSFNKAESI